MTLDEAIKHCEEVAEANEKQYSENPEQLGYTEKFYDCKECADEHRQLADWLKELKKYREHETTMFKPIATDTRGYACQFSCNVCDCIVSRSHYMRPSQFDYNYCPYCGRPVVERESDAE